MKERIEQYVEDKSLERYFRDNYQILMTSFERESLDLSWNRLAAKGNTPAIPSTIWGFLSWMTGMKRPDPSADTHRETVELYRKMKDAASREVRRESLNDPKEIYARIDKRLRDEYESGALTVNRCGKCRRIVATPSAQQCLWCGHDWHAEKAV